MPKTLYRALIAATLVGTFAAGAGANAMWADHPPRLDLALEHLSHAELLLPAAEHELPPDFSVKGRKTYDKHFDRAMKALQDTVDAIAGMIEAAEGG